jgi:hypothetical protein
LPNSKGRSSQRRRAGGAHRHVARFNGHRAWVESVFATHTDVFEVAAFGIPMKDGAREGPSVSDEERTDELFSTRFGNNTSGRMLPVMDGCKRHA